MKSIAIPLTPEKTIPAEESDRQTRMEEALIHRALKGDGEAFEALVRPHLPALYRLSARISGSRIIAEDAVQDTLEVAYRHLNRYEAGTSLKAWLASIAIKKAATAARSERRRKAGYQKLETTTSSPPGDEALIQAERVDKIRTLLERMPKTRREAALMRLDAGLSYAEIARALNTSPGSARVLVHLALKEIKKNMMTKDET